MKVQLASGRPVTIGALTLITGGVMPVTNSNPIHLIWTWVKGLVRKA
jgi:hypothetical protein